MNKCYTPARTHSILKWTKNWTGQLAATLKGLVQFQNVFMKSSFGPKYQRKI